MLLKNEENGMDAPEAVRKGDGPATAGLPIPLRAYILIVALAGIGLMVYLSQSVEWGLSTVGEVALFTALIVVAGSFPLPIAPRIKFDVNTAVFFAAALVLEPGVGALAGVVGVVAYTTLIRFWGERLRIPWYKHPFNAGQVALLIGATSLAFDAMVAGDGVMTVAAAAGIYYMINTAMVSVAAGLQLGISPMKFWWMGTRENGLAELSLLSFGFLGAVVYRESPWTVVALFIPVAIIYIAFSRLGRINTRLEEALAKLEALQGRIVSTSKLASVGAVSLDLLHQINNPMTILLGRLEKLEDHLEKDTAARAHLDPALDACRRMVDVAQTFGSIGEQKPVRVDVCDLVDEAIGIAGLRSSKTIEMRRDYESKDLTIEVNPVLIREALSNIVANSMDAVDDGGLITVEASRVNGHVKVRVSDDGVGISEEGMRALFEPFRTTKPMGHGLGLFAARHIVEMHHGTVEVESVEGEGTSVTVSLARANGEEEQVQVAHSDNPPLVPSR